MYCNRCGTQLASGVQFCANCGKAVGPGLTVAPPGAAASALPAAPRVDDGRVRRHIHLLATLWLINGIFRLAAVSSMMIFGRIFFPFTRGSMGPFVWPLRGRSARLSSRIASAPSRSPA